MVGSLPKIALGRAVGLGAKSFDTKIELGNHRIHSRNLPQPIPFVFCQLLPNSTHPLFRQTVEIDKVINNGRPASGIRQRANELIAPITRGSGTSNEGRRSLAHF